MNRTTTAATAVIAAVTAADGCCHWHTARQGLGCGTAAAAVVVDVPAGLENSLLPCTITPKLARRVPILLLVAGNGYKTARQHQHTSYKHVDLRHQWRRLTARLGCCMCANNNQRCASCHSAAALLFGTHTAYNIQTKTHAIAIACV